MQKIGNKVKNNMFSIKVREMILIKGACFDLKTENKDKIHMIMGKIILI
jgi:hypothetical protein